MNVYDFDNTIYDGESMADFYFFCAKRHKKLYLYLPKVLEIVIRYKLLLLPAEKLIDEASKFSAKCFHQVGDIREAAKQFWDKNEHKIKPFYKKNRKSDDLILTASSNFLIDEICRRLKIKNYICSDIDCDNGRIINICYRENKLTEFLKAYPDSEIDSFYTDSMNDEILFPLAKKVYMVKGNKIIQQK